MTDEQQAETSDVVAASGEPTVDGEHADDEKADGEDREAKRKRNRAKLALRIPDDEIARPETAPPPVVAPVAPPPVAPVAPPEPVAAASDHDAAPIVPMRIVDLASQPRPPIDDAPTPFAPPVIEAAPHQEGWTPFQPTAVDVVEAKALAEAAKPALEENEIDVAIDVDLAATDAHVAVAVPAAAPTEVTVVDDAPTTRRLPKPSSVPPPGPSSDSAIKLPPPPAVPDVTAAPKPAAEAAPPLPAAAKQSRPPAAALIDDAEAIPEVEPDLTEPPSLRPSDEELVADDLVSVEAVAPPLRPSAPPAPKPDASKAPPPPAGAAAAAVAKPLVIVPPTIAQTTPSPLAPPPVGDAQKRKGRLWWEELFGDDFIRTMAKISDEQIAGEVDFIEDSLGVAKGGTMLDLACGTGRHAIELARRGYQVVGFDLSLSMLARAAEEAQERDQKINFVQGDMRDMTFENTFDGVYCWSTSFGYFEEEKNALVCGKVHRALRAGGQFLIDVVNRDFIIQQSPSLVWFEGDGCICMDEMSVDWITSRMKVKRTMMLDDGRSKEIEYSIRVYSLHELGKLLHDQGFRVAEVSGRTATPGVFFGAAAPRVLILAEKK